jgi:hypothetical protein
MIVAGSCPHKAQKNDNISVPLSQGGKESIPHSHEGKEMAMVSQQESQTIRASAVSRYKTGLNRARPANVKKKRHRNWVSNKPLWLWCPNPHRQRTPRTMNLHPLKTSVFHQVRDQALFNIDPASGSWPRLINIPRSLCSSAS